MMEEQSKQRREDFKKYEMEKEHEHRQKLANMTEEEKQKEEERLKAERSKSHEKMHEPVSLACTVFIDFLYLNQKKKKKLIPKDFLFSGGIEIEH